MTEFARVHRQLVRTDFMVFAERCFRTLNPSVTIEDSWHLHAIAAALRQVDRGEILNLIVALPPRSGKSWMISVAYTAWRLGRDASTRIIAVSSDNRLVHLLAASFRAVVESDWYRRAFPAFEIDRRNNRRPRR